MIIKTINFSLHIPRVFISSKQTNMTESVLLSCSTIKRDPVDGNSLIISPMAATHGSGSFMPSKITSSRSDCHWKKNQDTKVRSGTKYHLIWTEATNFPPVNYFPSRTVGVCQPYIFNFLRAGKSKKDFK